MWSLWVLQQQPSFVSAICKDLGLRFPRGQMSLLGVSPCLAVNLVRSPPSQNLPGKPCERPGRICASSSRFPFSDEGSTASWGNLSEPGCHHLPHGWHFRLSSHQWMHFYSTPCWDQSCLYCVFFISSLWLLVIVTLPNKLGQIPFTWWHMGNGCYAIVLFGSNEASWKQFFIFTQGLLSCCGLNTA